MILASNPFFSSFSSSDLFGKFIFISLFILSVLSWGLLINKIKYTRAIQKTAQMVRNKLIQNRNQPLNLNFTDIKNPFASLYSTLRYSSGELLAKNENTALTSADIELIEGSLEAEMSNQSKQLEKNLFILPTIVSLAPFLGLLGTVWGILITLSELEAHAASMSLAGLSMALATTVLGLLVAIPPLIGYNYLRSLLRDFQVEMHIFSQQALAAVELQYRT